MRLTTTLSVLSTLGATVVAYALPTDLAHFYIVTTDQQEPTSNSSTLRGVSATTPYAEDPISQSYLLLRLLGPGYASLPNFTLASGTLSTVTSGPHGIGSATYNSVNPQSGSALTFLPSAQSAGSVGIEAGYLLSVGGESKGWTVCKSREGQDVLYWKGTGGGCRETWVQVVGRPPYKKA